MDFRGYERDRGPGGPPIDVQRKALAAEGVPADGEHPPIYTDAKLPKTKPLAQLAHAIKSLRGSALVAYDVATLGRDMAEIITALVEIGRAGGTLILCHPVRREFSWQPGDAEMVVLAAEGEALIRTEKYRKAGAKYKGAAPKLVGRTRDIALKHWGNPELTAKQAHALTVKESGVKISDRLMWQLGKKSDAEDALARPPPSKPAPVRAKPKPKRRKPARKPKVTT